MFSFQSKLSYNLDNSQNCIIVVPTIVIHTFIMRKVLAFGASSSKHSINQQFAVWAANQLENVLVRSIHLMDFEVPIFSVDRETLDGIPQKIIELKNIIGQSDAIVLSLAEHNGNFTAAFKNIYDWLSRIDRSIFMDLPIFLLSTSPGGLGGASVHKIGLNSIPRAGGNIAASFILPRFKANFSEDGIIGEELVQSFNLQKDKFEEVLHQEEGIK